MKCPHCGQHFYVPQDKENRWKNFLLVLEKNNFNRTKTAQELGVTRRTVRAWLSSMGLTKGPNALPKNPREKAWSKEEIALMITLGKQGLSYATIAANLGRTLYSVKGKAQALLLQQRQRQAIYKVRVTADQIRHARIVDLHASGMGLKMIAREMQLEPSIVKKHLERIKP